MEILYKWRVLEKDRRGRPRWRIVRAPMSDVTARFWAANNNKIVERINAPLTLGNRERPVSGSVTGPAVKARG